MAHYQISPGKAVGIFQLGDTLWHVLDLLRTRKNEYPKFSLSWDPQRPHESAVVIHLPALALYFPHPSQTLTLISFPSLASSNVTLTFETQLLYAPEQPLTRARIGRILGPTFADEGRGLIFPGIKFEMSAEGNGGREDIVRRLDVSEKEGERLSLPGQMISCKVQPNRGVVLSIVEEEPLEIILGQTTAQDLLVDLGHPLRKFWKEDDRLEKMWGGISEPGYCFWNYFQYGLDFLISPQFKVHKILCYSNIPGTPLFQRYARCPWTVSTSAGTLNLTSSVATFHSSLSLRPSQYEEEIDEQKSSASDEIRKASKSGTSRTKKKRSLEPPVMVLDRVVEGGLEGVMNVGESRLIGYDGLVIEEDQSSGGICSVLVWRNEGIQPLS
ncbi:hypothetical protein I313_03229 [Cryptococcus deuterogattii Ram5]|uniref:Uncharacterized protein n=1 Tax=Cryptococcus deuterogattii Ram5 TaxID=1296110 RepID=A0A0D0TXM6_9TREE|nr:hypothetical protein I313_03229 [Cryptococcus deuterogattii Ram5]